MNFPYQKNFNEWCKSQNLAPQTITSINQSIFYFWNYFLKNSNSEPKITNVSSQDIRSFIDYLEQYQHKTISTLNKYVTHLKKYFSFLYNHQLVKKYLFTDLHGYTFDRTPHICIDWIKNLKEIISWSEISLTTKKVLILIAYGFDPKTFLNLTKSDISSIKNPDYRAILTTNTDENPLIFQTKTGKEISALTSLTRKIAPDKKVLNFDLTPRKLRLSYVYAQVNDPSLSDLQLMELLQCSRKSLTYYRNQLDKIKLAPFDPKRTT